MTNIKLAHLAVIQPHVTTLHTLVSETLRRQSLAGCLSHYFIFAVSNLTIYSISF